jgi:hypothetical protein|tara:strand:+ start:395 stop:604 length:210 start_codon:yes stop_codon:yes gene_type:complete
LQLKSNVSFCDIQDIHGEKHIAAIAPVVDKAEQVRIFDWKFLSFAFKQVTAAGFGICVKALAPRACCFP